MSRGRSRSSSGGRRSRSPDESKALWRAVKDKPYDFEAWTRLLQYVERKDDTKMAADAFNAFFKRYPLCFGYWRKYAELERKNKRYEKALNIYERGLKEIPLSVDLWLSYIAYIKDIASGQKHAEGKTRTVYLRALEACGMDFRSDKLWLEYIDWEIANKEYLRASQLYDIILGTPTLGYATHFDRYKTFISSYEPDQILSSEEYSAISERVFEAVKDHLNGAEPVITEEYEEEIPEDDIVDENITMRTVISRKHAEVVLAEFRREIMERRGKLNRTNTEEVNSRLKFESNIKRPYFHVKPLEREQLLNWYNYLDYEIAEKKKKRIQILFERCVISCALYEEMWIKYATYYDSIHDTERAREIYRKAADVHCSRKPGIHLAFSAFEEKHGDSTAALAILHDYERKHPGYVAISMRKLQIERRRLVAEKSTDFTSIISKMESLISEPGNSRRVASFYSMKLARFHLKIARDRRSADRVLKDAINRDKDNLQLYMALIDVAFSSSHFRESEVLEALDYALSSRHLTAEQRFLFSQRKLDFLEDLGSDAGKLQQHYVEHLKLEKELSEPLPTMFSNLKRKLPPDDETPEKRPREDGDFEDFIPANVNATFADAKVFNVIQGNNTNGQSDANREPAYYASPNAAVSANDWGKRSELMLEKAELLKKKNPKKAIEQYQELYNEAAKREIYSDCSLAQRKIMETYLDLCDYDEVRRHAETYRAITEKSRDKSLLQLALHSMAYCFTYMGDEPDVTDLRKALTYACECSEYLDKYAKDIDANAEAVRISRDSRRRRAGIQTLLAEIYFKLGSRQEASRFIHKAEEYALNYEDTDPELLLNVLSVKHDVSHSSAKEQIMKEALALVKRQTILSKSRTAIECKYYRELLCSYENQKQLRNVLNFFMTKAKRELSAEIIEILKFIQGLLRYESKLSTNISTDEKCRIAERIADGAAAIRLNPLAYRFYQKMLQFANPAKLIDAHSSLAETARDDLDFEPAYKHNREYMKLLEQSGGDSEKMFFAQMDEVFINGKRSVVPPTQAYKDYISLFYRCNTNMKKVTVLDYFLPFLYVHTSLLCSNPLSLERSELQKWENERSRCQALADEEIIPEEQRVDMADDSFQGDLDLEFLSVYLNQNKDDDEALIQKARSNHRNQNGETELHLAAKKDNPEYVLKLIQLGFKVDAADHAGWTPLSEAVNYGHFDNVKALLEAGADVNSISKEGLVDDKPGDINFGSGITPLMDACTQGSVRIARLLMEFGADVNRLNSNGEAAVDILKKYIETRNEPEDECDALLRTLTTKTTVIRNIVNRPILNSLNEDVEENSRRKRAMPSRMRKSPKRKIKREHSTVSYEGPLGAFHSPERSLECHEELTGEENMSDIEEPVHRRGRRIFMSESPEPQRDCTPQPSTTQYQPAPKRESIGERPSARRPSRGSAASYTSGTSNNTSERLKRETFPPTCDGVNFIQPRRDFYQYIMGVKVANYHKATLRDFSIDLTEIAEIVDSVFEDPLPPVKRETENSQTSIPQ